MGSLTQQLDRDIDRGSKRIEEAIAPSTPDGVALTDEPNVLSLKSMKSTLSPKGQVTVPAELREQLGWPPGTVVRFELREEGLLITKGPMGSHPVDQVFGCLQLDKPVDSLLEEMRGPGLQAGSIRHRRPR
jgi:AbrB family looped-hinge helix DNA binding protein